MIPVFYKYRSWDNLFDKRVLTHNEIYLSSPNDFNDPFDCQVQTNFNLLKNKEEIEKYFEQAMNKDWELYSELGKDKQQVKELLLLDYLSDSEDFNKVFQNLIIKRQNKEFGIFSLSYRWDSILMWSHYSSQHTGYCVGFDTKSLIDTNLFNFGRPVTYNTCKNYPELHPLDEKSLDLFITTHHKANEWEYEKEYRFLKWYENYEATIEDRIFKIPDKCFAEIILGLRMLEENKLQILDSAKNKNIKVFQAQRIPNKFEIKRKRIF